MEVKYHPDVSTLMACAAGSQPEALCAVVISHLSFCKACMTEVQRMSQIGAALLAQIDAEALSPHTAMLSSESFQQERSGVVSAATVDHLIPAPLRAVLNGDLSELNWETQAPGVLSYSLPLSPTAKGDLKLIRLDPDVALPDYRYTGESLFLVIDGTCIFNDAQLARGDYLEFCDGHAPTIKADERKGCILLSAQEGFIN